MAGFIVPEEHDLASALIEIAEKHGKFNEDSTGIWAGYKPADENQYKAIGVKCSNCVLYRGGSECAIIALPVEPEGKCRFAVIPDGVVDISKAPPGKDIDVSVVQYFKKAQQTIPEYVDAEIKNREPDEEIEISLSELVPTQQTVNMRRVGDAMEYDKPITVWVDEDGQGYKIHNGHHRSVAHMFMGKESIPAKVYYVSKPVTATAGSKPAPKKDRIKGSKKNKPGSAASGTGITFSASVIKSLEKKVADHNEKAKSGRRVTLRMLKAVYRRGAGAYSTSHRPDQSRAAWSMARVNAFLKLVRSGRPTNSKYVQDNDLLPKMHPRHSEASSMSPLIASLAELANEDECPPATQDILINLENRQNAIDNVGYGPLNPKEPSSDFWQDKAERWNTTPEEARKSVCGNCVFFIRTPRMLDCIAEGIEQGGSQEEDAWGAIDQAELGYCEALDFKCAASRTCNAWAVGGPITED